MKLTLKIWRQKNRKDKGAFINYPVDNVDPEMSMLECLDVLNESLIGRGEEPVAFDHDCREGICGSCGFMINGIAHGPERATTVCQLSMRHFKPGQELVIEPWRARAFPLSKTSSSTAVPSIMSSSPAAISPSRPARRRTATQSSWVKKRQTTPWMLPPASAAGPVSPHAPTAPPRSLQERKSPTSASFLRASPSVTIVAAAWSSR